MNAAVCSCIVAALVTGLSACDSPATSRDMDPPAPRLGTDGPAAPAAPLRAKFAARSAREPLLRGADIRFTVLPGRVRLSGVVASAAAKLRAAELARDLAATAEVENRLIVRSDGIAQSPVAKARIYL
jgi:osmotically-inducible protein OsmY